MHADKRIRIPRIRVRGGDFSEEINKLSYPKNPEGFFIEVFNNREDIVGLFFCVEPIYKKSFHDVIEFAKYYDSLVIYNMNNKGCNDFKTKYKLDSTLPHHKKSRMRELVSDQSFLEYDISVYINTASLISSYGRLKYPLGLDENYQKIYSDYIESSFHTFVHNYANSILLNLRYDFVDDLIDILNFLLSETKLKESIETLIETILDEVIQDYDGMWIPDTLKIISGISDNLLNEESIFLFIDKAKQYTYDYFKEGILDFLLEYRSKHFPSTKRPPQKFLMGVQRVKLLESDSPRKIPLRKRDFFLELIDSEGKTKALYFIVDNNSCYGGKYTECEGWEDFSECYDEWFTPNYQWERVEASRWLQEVFSIRNWDIQKLLDDVGVTDINDLNYDQIPAGYLDGYMDKILSYAYDGGPRLSSLPALFLMSYGRLMYPYKLSKENRENCELYIRGFVNEHLIHELQYISEDPQEISELFNFCASVFPSKESFREAYSRKAPRYYRNYPKTG